MIGYETRRDDLLRRAQACDKRGELLGWLRLIAFLLLLIAAWRALGGDWPAVLPGIAAGVVALVTLGAFLWLVRRHAGVRRHERWLREMAVVNAEAAHRVHRDWSALPDPRWAPAGPDHPYALDLDVIGIASLVQLLPPVSRAPARDILRGWLLAPAAAAAIPQRQRAVAELAPRIELRDTLTVLGRRVWLDQSRLDRLLRWAHEPPALLERRGTMLLALAIPMATVLLGTADFLGALGPPLWALPLLGGVSLLAKYRASTRSTVEHVAALADTAATYGEMLRVAREATLEAPLLRSLQEELASGGAPADVALHRLRRLADWAETRRSPMLHLPLQLLFLWDVHVAHALEGWRRDHGNRFDAWMRALGEFESLAALGGLAHGNPGWGFPHVDPAATEFRADGLAHPLLRADASVANDVSVGPPGTFLFVTGSNMAGKSTLLRAIGLNVVLAQAGCVASARQLRMPPVELHTSMRIQDSLSQGVSYFMAELLRLRQIVAAAERAGDDGRRLLYLIDEMLQGTNSHERTIASRRVLAHLVAGGAIGAVATHDLRLADDESLAGAARAVHFREDVTAAADGPVLRFDYRLRDGVATTTNALRLMSLVGLPVSADHPEG